MHRRAILSDIHGNLPALEAVLADIGSQNVDEIVCLGDICGYGPQPVECIQLMREHAAWVLLGNHDEALYKEPLDFSRNAYDAILWQRKIMQPGPDANPAVQERWEWLQSLAPERVEKNVSYVHASPRDPIHEYVLKEDFDAASGGPSADAKAMFDAVEWLCFCGHSHRPGVVAEDYRWWNPDELPGGRSFLRHGFKTIINVGSVGQPRDGHPEACYVLYDDLPRDTASPPEPAAAPDDPRQSGTLVMPRPPSGVHGMPGDKDSTAFMPAVTGGPVPGRDDETRSDRDPALQAARDTVLMRSPKVLFRRVAYDITEAQKRFFAAPDLPRYNGIRLARGI